STDEIVSVIRRLLPGHGNAGPGLALAHPVAMRGRLFLGTSGYVYPHWRRRFYPAYLPAREWLSFYARHFDTVELNNPFYRLPAKRAFRQWRETVPDDFVFSVKASRYLTHLRRLRAPRATACCDGSRRSAPRWVRSSSSYRPSFTPIWPSCVRSCVRSADSHTCAIYGRCSRSATPPGSFPRCSICSARPALRSACTMPGSSPCWSRSPRTSSTCAVTALAGAIEGPTARRCSAPMPAGS